MIRPIGREELEIDLLSLAKNQLQTCHFLDPYLLKMKQILLLSLFFFFVEDVDLIFGEENW